MLRSCVACLLLLAVLVACGPTSAVPEGKPEVFARIAAMTDCAELQKEFDTASTNGDAARGRGDAALGRISTNYMKAADDRMKALGCTK